MLKTNLKMAAQNLDEAKTIIEDFLKRKTFTIGEAQHARKLLLHAVRYALDDCCFSHMPDKRYY